MREIKFRVWYPIEWDELGDKPIKFSMSYDWAFEEWAPINDLLNNSMPNDSCLMQYTGLKDKNGVEIYEGDILNVCNGSINGKFWMQSPYEVKWVANKGWDICLFCWDKEGNDCMDLSHWCEVIGNIYEKPELLK